jgi:hypothetical protein
MVEHTLFDFFLLNGLIPGETRVGLQVRCVDNTHQALYIMVITHTTCSEFIMLSSTFPSCQFLLSRDLFNQPTFDINQISLRIIPQPLSKQRIRPQPCHIVSDGFFLAGV